MLPVIQYILISLSFVGCTLHLSNPITIAARSHASLLDGMMPRAVMQAVSIVIGV